MTTLTGSGHMELKREDVKIGNRTGNETAIKGGCTEVRT